MGDVIAGPWKDAVPSTEPSHVDRLIINEVNNLYNMLLVLEQRVHALEGAGGHDVRP